MYKRSRIMYLDIDDCILMWNNQYPIGCAAPMAAEFIKWADEHFEIRWMTAWCPSGMLSNKRAIDLSLYLNCEILPEKLQSFNNPMDWWGEKIHALDLNDSREWVWVEDDLLAAELEFLKLNKVFKNYYNTNVSKNLLALQNTWDSLAERFDLPSCPKPYTTIPILPNYQELAS